MSDLLRLVRLREDHPHMLLSIAEGIMELHVNWCGSPLNPLHPEHNPACRISAQRFDLELTTNASAQGLRCNGSLPKTVETSSE